MFSGSREVSVYNSITQTTEDIICIRDISNESQIICKCTVILCDLFIKYQIISDKIIDGSVQYSCRDIAFDTSGSEFVYVIL